MKTESFIAIARELNNARVPFLIVEGIAVIHHGYGRVTQDVDLVIHLKEEVILRVFCAFESIGYRPVVSITAEQFADPSLREQWCRENGMKVLQFWSDRHCHTPLDIFLTEPFDFQREFDGADICEVTPGLPVRIISLSSLLRMKKEAGRPRDLADIDELNLLHGRRSSYDRET